jgi:TfoX/Sxy family transcriptional regulator of competence genes
MMLERVRELLADRPVLREKAMFGGVSFMVDEKMVVSVRGDGSLLVRVDPARSPELVAEHGGRIAEMGAGRSMGPSWLHVDADLLARQGVLEFWVREALTRHDESVRASKGPRTSRR